MSAKPQHRFHTADQITSSIIHAMGGYLGAAALVLLVVFAVRSEHQVAWKVVSGSIYASTIIILYSISSLYHAVTNEYAKKVLHIFDHMAIYFLIAGTYTPFCLVTLRHGYPVLAWTIFGIVWGLTLAGVIVKLFTTGRFRFVSTIAYIAMGWLVIFIIKPLYESLAFGGIVWLVLGGVLYTFGTIFYLWRRLPLNHTIWHTFVLAGTICHFFGILFYVMM
jgi:hemolysin III